MCGVPARRSGPASSECQGRRDVNGFVPHMCPGFCARSSRLACFYILAGRVSVLRSLVFYSGSMFLSLAPWLKNEVYRNQHEILAR